MSNERYIAGVPCWVDSAQPDPAAAATFYSGLFGWDVTETMPPDADGSYLMATIGGDPVAAISSPPPGTSGAPSWSTYIWVDSADEVAARVPAAGGTVVAEPFDVFGAGRMATFADREGASISVWQPGEHRGATRVNEHGTVNFNDLHFRDPDAAKAFYGEVFGWGTLELGGPGWVWTLPAYGNHLEALNPGTRARMKEMGAPEGFLDVVATAAPADDGAAPHWGVTFAVDDADAAAARAAELGGRVLVEPFDAPWVRMTVLADPAGATFVASKFVPENKDLG